MRRICFQALFILSSLIFSSEAFTSTFVNADYSSPHFSFEAGASFGRAVGGEDVDKGRKWTRQMNEIFKEASTRWEQLLTEKDFSQLLLVINEPTPQTKPSNTPQELPKKGKTGSHSARVNCFEGLSDNLSFNFSYSPKDPSKPLLNDFFKKAYQRACETIEKLQGFSHFHHVQEKVAFLKVKNQYAAQIILSGNSQSPDSWRNSKLRQALPQMAKELESLVLKSSIGTANGLVPFLMDQNEAPVLGPNGILSRVDLMGDAPAACDENPKGDCIAELSREVPEGADGNKPWHLIQVKIGLKGKSSEERKKLLSDLESKIKSLI